MASIASLVIQMAVDSSRIAQGFQRTQAQSRTGAQRIVAAFGGVRTAALAAVAAAGLVVTRFTEAADQLIKTADASGIAFQSFQDLQQGLDLAGVNASGFQRGLRTLANAFQQAEAGSRQYVDAFNEIGLSYQALDALSPEQRFLAVVDALSNVDDATRRTALANDLLGRSFADVNVNIEDVISSGGDVANITDRAARQSERFNDSLAALFTSLRNLVVNALRPFLAILTPIINGINFLINGVNDLITFDDAATNVMALNDALEETREVVMNTVPTVMMATDAVEELGTTAARTIPMVSSLAQGTFNRATDAILDFFETGRLGVREFVRDFIRQFARIQIQRSLLGLFGGPGQFFSGITARQFGGPVSSGRPYVVGEAGPELFVPRNSGEIVPNGQFGGGSTQITINAVDTQSFETALARNPEYIFQLGQLGGRQAGVL